MTRLLALGIFNVVLFSSFSQSLIPIEILSENYLNLKNAVNLFEEGDYIGAELCYKDSYPTLSSFPFELYKYSICSWLSDDTVFARKVFSSAVELGLYFKDIKYLNQSPFITELSFGDSIMTILTNRIYADSLCLYPDYRDKLLKLKETDQFQRVQQQLSDLEFNRNDSLNRMEFSIILNKIGWPGFNEVGYSGEGASFLIAQHSDNDIVFQKKCLILMQEQLIEGNISLSNYAMIIDRYLVNQGGNQIFGTQLVYNEQLKSYETKKCAYPTEINFLRKLFMLMPLNEYINLMNDIH